MNLLNCISDLFYIVLYYDKQVFNMWQERMGNSKVGFDSCVCTIISHVLRNCTCLVCFSNKREDTDLRGWTDQIQSGPGEMICHVQWSLTWTDVRQEHFQCVSLLANVFQACLSKFREERHATSSFLINP